MIWRAPPMRAPWTIDSPTPPQPNTATVCPASSPELRNAAPTPVKHAAADQRRLVERQFRVDPHERILVQQHLFGIARNADELAETAGPFATAAGAALSGRVTMPPVHKFGWPERHCGQLPQNPERQATT